MFTTKYLHLLKFVLSWVTEFLFICLTWHSTFRPERSRNINSVAKALISILQTERTGLASRSCQLLHSTAPSGHPARLQSRSHSDINWFYPLLKLFQIPACSDQYIDQFGNILISPLLTDSSLISILPGFYIYKRKENVRKQPTFDKWHAIHSIGKWCYKYSILQWEFFCIIFQIYWL